MEKDSKDIKLKKKDIAKELSEYKKLCEQHLYGWKRERADFENYRKRMEKKSLELIKFANEELMFKILPILDNFDQALKHVPKGWQGTSWLEGIEHIQKHFKNILESEGLSEIKLEKGDKFDPRICEALEAEKKKKNNKDCKVAEVLQKGYMLNGKVIRPAKVKVE